ncbi:MAG: type II toxin-antitoxin system HicB family antitoxin [Ignavibacteriae bacterium]|nr:type II toxin-antitoxin system HicB family antitoxin [Ignavibacteriota bacterium]
MQKVKIVIERHDDGYVGYPLGFTRGAIVGQGETYAEALKDTESAIQFFIQHYGKDAFLQHLEGGGQSLDAYIAETSIAV